MSTCRQSFYTCRCCRRGSWEGGRERRRGEGRRERERGRGDGEGEGRKGRGHQAKCLAYDLSDSSGKEINGLFLRGFVYAHHTLFTSMNRELGGNTSFLERFKSWFINSLSFVYKM